MSFESARWITSDIALPIFRREIILDKPISHAIVRLCGLGQHELFINGMSTSDGNVLEPAWSDYRKTCYYVTRTVRDRLRRGTNQIDVWLGNGMYNVPSSPRYKKFKGTFGPLKLIMAMQLVFADDTVSEIVSDKAWNVARGPITFSCIYGGEDFDARLGPPAEWKPVQICDGPGGRLIERQSPPLRIMQTFSAVKTTDREPGKRVYDLGQNFSGFPILTARGAAGATIKLTTGELLDDAGCVTQKNSGSPVSFSYTLAGNGEEHWHPRFSYTGFRYVQAEGDLVALTDLKGAFIHSAAKQIGHFECSNDLFNRIHQLILNAIKSNLHNVITDCPHREKLGWLEQTHLMGPAIFYNFDAASLYAKVSADMRDAQHENGCVPTIAPQYTSFKPPWDVFNDSPEWGSAVVLNPWLVYQCTGDGKILTDNYASMKRYVDYLATREVDGLVDYGLGDWYDIGPDAGGGAPGFSKLTSKALTATAIAYADNLTLAGVAAVLGRGDDAVHYTDRSREIAAAFNKRLFDPARCQYDTASQTACAMPLALGLVDPAHRAAILESLIKDIRAHNNHITAGDIGFKFVLAALAEAGRSDVIFDLLSQRDPPSYGSQLARGATTLTEAWDANPRVSQNHLMLGHAESWFYEHLAGIQVDLSQPAPKQISIRPTPVGDITWATARYDSALGTIKVHWERDAAGFRLNVAIPAGAAALIAIPAADPATVTEGGQPVLASRRVRSRPGELSRAVFSVDAGEFFFENHVRGG